MNAGSNGTAKREKSQWKNLGEAERTGSEVGVVIGWVDQVDQLDELGDNGVMVDQLDQAAGW
jgi:hypothetical protein